MAIFPNELQRAGWPMSPLANPLPSGGSSEVFTGLPPMMGGMPPVQGAPNTLMGGKRPTAPPRVFNGMPRGRI